MTHSPYHSLDSRLSVPADSSEPVLTLFEFHGMSTHRFSWLSLIRIALEGGRIEREWLRWCRYFLVYKAGDSENNPPREVVIVQNSSRRWKIADLAETGCHLVIQTLLNLTNAQMIMRLPGSQNQSHRVIITSARSELYLRPLMMRLGLKDVMATQRATNDGVSVTRELCRLSYSRPGKVSRLASCVRNLHRHYLFIWGDGGGDRSQLAAADAPL